MELSTSVREVMSRLRARGFRALLAGGCVRDFLLDRTPKDIDIATDARPEEIQEIFPQSIAVGAAFGVILVLWRGRQFEVATFRRDGEYKDGRHPESVTFGSAEEDARRRDFTINGLFLDPETGEILDYVGGRADLSNRVLRTIGSPEERFHEDRLRLIRAVRFHANLGFAIEKRTLQALRSLAHQIRSVSGERIREEFLKILTGPRPRVGVVALDETGLLHEILPEVEKMKGTPQPPEFHPEGDVWIHTLLMLEKMRDPSPELALGVLLHDVGKPATISQVAGDRIRFNRHDEVGAKLAASICQRLRLSNDQARHVESLVADHMKFASTPQMRESTLRRFLCRPRIEEHLELHRLDCLSSHRNLEIHSFCERKIEQYSSEPLVPKPLLSGHDLIELGYSPGPSFSRVLRALQDAQMEKQVGDREAAIRFVRERFRLEGTTDFRPRRDGFGSLPPG